MALVERRRHVQAAQHFLRAAKLEPQNWRLPNDAGVCLFHARRYQDALRCYDTALVLMPDMATVLFNRALVLAAMRRPDEAFGALRSVLEIERTHPGAYLELGKLHLARGRYDAALEAFDAALLHGGRDSHDVALALLNKARIYLGPLQLEQQGLAQIDALARLGDAAAITKLAGEVFEDGRARALRIVERAVKVAPELRTAQRLHKRLTPRPRRPRAAE